ncbi:MAG TPA: universal stress protein [Thermodesulfobacteriota bacterium]|nr:universal stress protein [Thermodesulfobacteriota bacterium]
MKEPDVDKSLELFGLSSNFTERQLKEAYRDLVQIWHPDKYVNKPRLYGKAQERLIEINKAYEVLQEYLRNSDTASGKRGMSSAGKPASNLKGTDAQAGSKFRQNRENPKPFSLKRIFHPSDFSRASNLAFIHALKLALLAKAEFNILHTASKPEDVNWTDFPGVRRTLERWGMLPKGSAKEEVMKLGIQVQKILSFNEDPLLSTLSFLKKDPADLIVLATNQRAGVARWLGKAVAEPIARRSGQMTLFIPKKGNGFISPNNGAVTLQRILIPVDNTPGPQSAIGAASLIARVLGPGELLFVLLHVGEEQDMPEVHVTEQEGWTWEKTVRQGSVVEQILEVAAEFSPNLIVMATQGHKGFLDALRGSTTERIVRRSPCPVLAIPSY